MKMDELRKKHARKGLPTRVVLRDLSEERVRDMSESESRQAIEAERAKLMLIKQKIRDAKARMARDLREINSEKRRIVAAMTEIELSELTRESVARARKLTDQMAELRRRSDDARARAENDVLSLTRDADYIERNVDRIIRIWGRR